MQMTTLPAVGRLWLFVVATRESALLISLTTVPTAVELIASLHVLAA